MKKCLLFLVIITFLIATACSPSKDSLEGRINQLEVYLIDLVSGVETSVKPDIYELNDADKQALINGVEFNIIKGKERVFIEFLNSEWPDWKNFDGFVLTYLKHIQQLEEKSAEIVVDDRQQILRIVQIKDLSMFYRQIITVMKEAANYKENSLFSTEDTGVYTWLYEADTFILKTASLQIFDIDSAMQFQVSYKAENLTLDPLQKKTLEYGHTSLAKLAEGEFEKSIKGLLVQGEGRVMITFESHKKALQNEAEWQNAILKNQNYSISDEAVGKFVGYLSLNWLVDDKIEKTVYYKLYEALVEN